MLSTDNLSKQCGPRSGLTFLVWTQIVWRSDGIPERFYFKKLILKKSADDKKACKITQQACLFDLILYVPSTIFQL